jgi:hypothetical protein
MSATREAWLHPEGASYQTLSALRATVDGLPESYLALLTRGNGGETSLAVPPFNFCLDSAEAALDYWRSGTYTLPGVFVFGGNGGGALLALDMRHARPWPIVSFDPIDPAGSIETVAVDFDSFLGVVDTQ